MTRGGVFFLLGWSFVFAGDGPFSRALWKAGKRCQARSFLVS